jgi:Flavin reductase like domain
LPFCAAAVAWAASTTEQKFRIIEPKILYFGTPVALVHSRNEEGSTDLAPISSFCALGWTLILGLLTERKTADGVARYRECVVNLPSPEMWQNVEKTDSANRKKSCGKTQIRAVPSRAAQVCGGRAHSCCERSGRAGAGQGMPAVHMEARVTALHQLNGEKLSEFGGGMAAEVDVARVHVADDFVLQDKYINPANWSR